MYLQEIIDSIDTTNVNTHGLPDYCLRKSSNPNNGTIVFDLYTKANNGNSTYPNGWYTRNYQLFYDIETGLTYQSANNPLSGNYLQNWTQATLNRCEPASNYQSVYQQFWFPFLSCVSFLFIVFMIYRIFIKRLLP